MITAKFSNGFTDTYKGNRAVKAAWMITRKDTGEVLASGHSLDRVRAQKTAEGKQREQRDITDLRRFDVPSRLYAGANYAYLYRRRRSAWLHGPRGYGCV